MERISIAQPVLAGNERKYVMDCLETNWISSIGKYIPAFEEAFANFCNVKHAVAVNNGTTALHLALVALGLEPGDEVIVPTVTYIATANAVKYCGGVPVLADSLPGTMNIDPADVEQRITRRTRAIIPVHLYGHPAEMHTLISIAQRHGLKVLEDAAEAHGAEVNGSRVGAIGDCATFSFFGNKIITTGEGGMVTTNDDALAGRLRLFRNQGVDPDRRYWFPVIGYNYRMTNVQAAIGLGQMETIDQALADRQRLARWYDEALAPLSNMIELPQQADWARHVFWMYTIFLKEGGDAERSAVMRRLDELGIETRPVFHPLHKMPPYKEDSHYPVADEWAARGINLPTHQALTQADVARIADALTTALAVQDVLGRARSVLAAASEPLGSTCWR
jgi:perosamine synthetase